MTPARRLRGEEGQVFPALLLVVVVLLFAGLALGQLGSASDQRGQTQTAADAAAVAAAQEMLAAAILYDGPAGLPPGIAHHLGLPGSADVPAAAACAAANHNWTANDHRTPVLDCVSALRVTASGNAATVGLTAPPGEIVRGPAADTSGDRAGADARAEVVFRRCPSGYGPLADAVLGAVVDHAAAALGLGDPGCGPGLGPLLAPSPVPAPSPPASPLPTPLPLPSPSPPDLHGLPSGGDAYDAVARSFRVQLVD